MEIEIVSKKIILFSLVCSVILLLINLSRHVAYPNYLYICNEKDKLDIYIRDKGKDIIYNPLNLKNTLFCLGKGMPFYDRNIESIHTSSHSLTSQIESRYDVASIQEINSLSYQCIKAKKTYLILQKSIILDTFLFALQTCKPDEILVAGRYKSTNYFKAYLSHKYKITIIKNGDYKRINL